MSWRSDDDEYLREPDNPCPCCERELKIQRYYDEGRFVELNASCSCGYNYNDSYGAVSVDYPEGYDEDGEKIVEEDEE